LNASLLTIHILRRTDFTEALYAYRQEQQTLAGLSLSQIEEGVLSVVRRKYPSQQVSKIDCFRPFHSAFLFYFPA
jgi:hypothetical protein